MVEPFLRWREVMLLLELLDGRIVKVHMPSSARAGTLAANNPQDRRAAKEREDAKLLMLFGLLFCRLCKTMKNGVFFYSQVVVRPVKGCITQNAIPQCGDSP